MILNCYMILLLCKGNLIFLLQRPNRLQFLANHKYNNTDFTCKYIFKNIFEEWGVDTLMQTMV